MTSAAAPSRPGPAGKPPEVVPAGPLLLRRTRAEDAVEIASVVRASLDHLRPWMAWATPEAADHRAQAARITESDQMWAGGTDYIYSIFLAGGGALVGTIGLHRRVGDCGIEIGYWIAADQTRRGYATEAARALTSVAMTLPGVSRVEIHCDEGNTASAGVPRKLGYRLERIAPHVREAPAERGQRMIWVWDGRGVEPGEGSR